MPLTPECRLVFAAAHVAPDNAVIGDLVRQPLDWGRVIAIAELEKATSPLWRVLERAGIELVPRAAAEHLRRSAMVSDFRMLRLGAHMPQARA